MEEGFIKHKEEISWNPLERIALSMSGGGYRAASFHLGILSYLNAIQYNNKPLLENVKAISTVSGGTITGAFYAVGIQKNKPFNKIYHELLKWMREQDLVKDALTKISTKGIWKYAYKKKNLINAFAEIYDETLFKNDTLEVLNSLENSHLEFVCFNATEFLTGLQFRFQHGGSYNFFGTNELRISNNHYIDVRVGDIVAASSAFPGGFEPLSLPDDFFDPDSEVYRMIQKKLKDEGGSMGLMDGGIFDNQGTSSLLRYENKKSTTAFDLYFLCDVSSPYLAPFRFSEEKAGRFRDRTLGDQLNRLKKIKKNSIWLPIIICAIGLLLIALGNLQNNITSGIGIAIFILGVFSAVARSWLVKKAKGWVEDFNLYLKKLIPDFFEERLTFFDYKKTKIGRLEVLLLDRINSLKLLFPDIFLKRIRQLQYNGLYENERFDFRRVSCLIKELTVVDFKKTSKNFAFMATFYPELKGETYLEIIGKNIKEYVDKASEFSTTLWFTNDDFKQEKIKALVVSGQVGCCQDLMVYVSEIINSKESGFESLDTAVQNSLKELHAELLRDWLQFKDQPDWLYPKLDK
ncbi:patatin-like phospholipase family protein [Gelidibacter salicanalis]|uniref:Patatin-like phospholipase family protein n=1 Tax=Gelidibacter salicanalis TaxID=291193 RepID=A0A934KYH1_9FLAO|nr:patatin-like phospholipase family protein [Gelidibacter salicanalis]MBJ7882912.1 patatin-like phospholipase family protein [Gelidibacter salicanalis]